MLRHFGIVEPLPARRHPEQFEWNLREMLQENRLWPLRSTLKRLDAPSHIGRDGEGNPAR
jgi:hypothetical protein